MRSRKERAMSELIKREDAIKAVLGITMYEARVPIDTVIFKIKDIPAVKMVRCKECVYRYEAQYGISHKWCDRTAGAVFTVTDDGYCAWGEKKEPQTADGDGEVQP